MARIFSLSIKNFRSIKSFFHTFPDVGCAVIIGRGDSGKSSILKAISLVLCPNWNPNISDYDFTRGDTSQPIEITAVVKDIPDELMTQSKYGSYYQLIKGDGITPEIDDIEADQSKKVLKIRLTIDDTLEPKWAVVSDREVGDISISHKDRAKLNMFMVSDYVDNHFTYSKFSPLYATFCQQTDSNERKQLGNNIRNLAREAWEVISKKESFSSFNAITKKVIDYAKVFGISAQDLTTMLEFRNDSYTESNLTLHSEDVPFRLRGKGSKRLLSIALQYGLANDGGIVLIDEIEQGLEPDRIRNLAHILSTAQGNGQIFFTTHSKDAILEACANQIFMMMKGETSSSFVVFSEGQQGLLRRKPELFFTKRLIVCEGVTEEGIIRAFNDHLRERYNTSLAAMGIVHISGGGDPNHYQLAREFKELGNDVLIWGDCDKDDTEEQKSQALAVGCQLIQCEVNKSREEQLFHDLPWEAVCELIDYAFYIRKQRKLNMNSVGFGAVDIAGLREHPELNLTSFRDDIAKRAKKESWYKSTTHGEELGRIWLQYFDELDENCTLRREYNDIFNWIRIGDC